MTTGRGTKFLVFVSHASRDRELALRLAAILDSLGIPTFVYEKYQVGGQNRFEVIRDRITECPYFVVLWTRRGRAREWVNQEIGFATAKDKQIIPLVETSPILKRRIPHLGFAELNDPLNLSPDQPEECIGELLRTLMTYTGQTEYN